MKWLLKTCKKNKHLKEISKKDLQFFIDLIALFAYKSLFTFEIKLIFFLNFFVKVMFLIGHLLGYYL